MRARRTALLLCAAAAIAGLAPQPPRAAEDAGAIAAPPEHRRPPDQTFLTFPELFLVFSPAEYAAYVREHTPTRFPFLGHVRQFWQSYGAVYERIRAQYPFNAGYHVMIMVIGTSTTVEYALRAAYETLIGRLSELTAGETLTEEDRYGAAVAQDYVDFIRVEPWYKYDFRARLAGLWRDTSLWGPAPLRKWERKYALTTECAIKPVYGWLIRKGTQASYDAPLPVTAVVLDRLPEGIRTALPELRVLKPLPGGAVLVTVPRYDAFMRYAGALAQRGASFVEIAGNRSTILVSAIVPKGGRAPADARVLFTQPILTQPGHARFALEVPVAALAPLLDRLRSDGIVPEHVFDF